MTAAGNGATRAASWLLPYLSAAGFVLLATAAAYLSNPYIPVGSLSFVYLMAILFSARQYGLWPALFAVVLGVTSLDYFFIPPRFSFEIGDPADAAVLIFFTAVAIVVSDLTTRWRNQMQRLAEQARVTEELYAFSGKITGIGSIDALLPIIADRIAGLFEGNVVILLRGEDGLKIRAAYPPEQQLESSDFAAAHRSWVERQAQARAIDHPKGSVRLFVPMQSAGMMMGVIALDRQDSRQPTAGERRLLEAVAEQAAVAMERIHLAIDIDDARRLVETEKLRNALLTAVSHDLRTPLAGIIGALGSLTRFGPTYDTPARDELLAVALEEAERLNRFIGNLLDMAKLQAGGMGARLEPTDLADAVSEALRQAGSLLKSRKVVVNLPPDLPLAIADAVLLHRVVFNLFDNASKYSPAESTIEITGRGDSGAVFLEVKDEGQGIRRQQMGALFGSSPGHRSAGRQPAGTGLGLAICRGFLDAMSGHLEAADRPDKAGAVFTVRLPVAEFAPAEEAG